MLVLLSQVPGSMVLYTAPAEEAADQGPEAQEHGLKDEDDPSYPGSRMCKRCQTKSYLRQGICYNMACVPWID